MLKILFVCEANHDRSPTAEDIYRNYPGIEAKSAGRAFYATTPIDAQLAEWADVIFCMEDYQKDDLIERFSTILKGKEVVDLDIQDYYYRGDARLQELIRKRMEPWIAKYKQEGLIE